MKIKIFTNTYYPALENEVNRWISNYNITNISNVSFSVCSVDTCVIDSRTKYSVCICYEE